jgi:glycosyltransferase involved in cell wall biosynthesis
VGVLRALSLAKYLPAYGFEVHVLKARNAAAPVHDPSLLAHIPAAVRVHSAFTPELPFAFRQKLWRRVAGGNRNDGNAQPDGAAGAPRWKSLVGGAVRRVLCPEPEVLWVPFALRQARRIVRQHAIDSVLVTAPPFSAFLVGNALKEEFPALRLISDFRDDWLRFYVNEFQHLKNDYTRRKAAAIERRTVELSDQVVVVTQTMLDHIRARYPDQKSQKFAFIPNGYDPEAFRGLQPQPRVDDKLVISHVGTVYSASSPRYYLDALEGMPEAIRDSIETRFIGRIADDELPYLAPRRISLKMLGGMPQHQALAHMAEADYLLLVMTDGPSLTGKIFEYMATGKPILAITPPDGEVARILHQTGAGWCAAPNDLAGIRAMLKAAYERSRNRENGFHPDWEAIRRFERPRLAGDFGRLMACSQET